MHQEIAHPIKEGIITMSIIMPIKDPMNHATSPIRGPTIPKDSLTLPVKIVRIYPYEVSATINPWGAVDLMICRSRIVVRRGDIVAMMCRRVNILGVVMMLAIVAMK
jgi:hypothetical protein